MSSAGNRGSRADPTVDGSSHYTMDIFQHRYYRLNKIFMTVIGQWPYQTTRVRGGFLAVFLVLGIANVPPLLLGLVKYRNDWNSVLECVIACGFAAVSLAKLIGIVWYSQKVCLHVLGRQLIASFQFRVRVKTSRSDQHETKLKIKPSIRTPTQR